MTPKERIEYLNKIELLLQLKSRLVPSDLLSLEFYRSICYVSSVPLWETERRQIDYLIRMFYKNIKPVLKRINN